MEKIYGTYGDQTFWQRVLDQIYDKLISHDEIKVFFEGKDLNRIKCMHVMLLSTALQSEGGHFPLSISRVHRSLNITERVFIIYKSIYERVLIKNGISKQDTEIIMNMIDSFKQDLVTYT